jgi:hypothetical protein
VDLQDHASALDAQLSQQLGNNYTGEWFDAPSGRIKIGITSEGYERSVEQDLDNLGLADNADIVTSTSSWEQLLNATLDAHPTWRSTPEGGEPDPLAQTHLQARLQSNLKTAQHAGQLRLDPQARALWWDAYAKLSEPTDGLTGALCARAEAHTIRLALIYALIDGKHSITPTHLHSALALWDYAGASATWALGHASGDPLAEQIHTALLNSRSGLTRTQLRDLFQRNRSGVQVEQALAVLAHSDRAHSEQIQTAGRPAELWHAQHSPQAP